MTKKKPLITYAISCYNQRKFIEAAIHSALAQSYEPLEIIISDDCSSDDSWEAILSSVYDYKGSHQVIIRQIKSNLGTYAHLLDIVSASSGELIVFACGDDVSKPERVDVLYREWALTGAWALDSRYDLIDDKDRVLLANQYSDALQSSNLNLRRYFLYDDGPVYIVHGASAAYDRRIFNYAPFSSDRILSEDGVLSILVNVCREKAVHVNQSLLLYRMHDDAISNNKDVSIFSLKSIREHIAIDQRRASHLYLRERLFISIARNCRPTDRCLNVSVIHDNYILQLARSQWHLLGLKERWNALVTARRLNQVCYLLPCILGTELASASIFLKKKLLSDFNAVLVMCRKSRAKYG